MDKSADIGRSCYSQSHCYSRACRNFSWCWHIHCEQKGISAALICSEWETWHTLAFVGVKCERSSCITWGGRLFKVIMFWLFAGVKVLLAGEQQAAVTVAVEGLMDAKPSPELDSFLTFDPKVPLYTLPGTETHLCLDKWPSMRLPYAWMSSWSSWYVRLAFVRMVCETCRHECRSSRQPFPCTPLCIMRGLL